MVSTVERWAQASAVDVRRAARAGELTASTAGMAGGFVQVNLVILPGRDAADFLRFCQGNPKPCPLLAVSEPGERGLPRLGADLDIATDVPRYRVFRHGQAVADPTDIVELWQDDLVTFALGCSFTFDHVLSQADIALRHVEQGCNVSMYDTSLPLARSGPFGGNMVVSMRPLNAADAIRAIQISTRFPLVHGAPVHLGDPDRIGIRDIAAPEYGEPVAIRDGELPVFWACGVTPQRALVDAGLPLAMTHSPGHMLVTDLREHEIAVC